MKKVREGVRGKVKEGVREGVRKKSGKSQGMVKLSDKVVPTKSVYP